MTIHLMQPPPAMLETPDPRAMLEQAMTAIAIANGGVSGIRNHGAAHVDRVSAAYACEQHRRALTLLEALHDALIAAGPPAFPRDAALNDPAFVGPDLSRDPVVHVYPPAPGMPRLGGAS